MFDCCFLYFEFNEDGSDYEIKEWIVRYESMYDFEASLVAKSAFTGMLGIDQSDLIGNLQVAWAQIIRPTNVSRRGRTRRTPEAMLEIKDAEATDEAFAELLRQVVDRIRRLPTTRLMKAAYGFTA